MAPFSDLPPGASVTHASGADLSSPPDLRFVHFNDVYHLDPSSAEPVGGIARFVTVCKEYRHDAAESDGQFAGQVGLVSLFSGDAFNPSLESSVTKGAHMVPVLNAIGVDCACVGNHDFDFGVDQFSSLISKTTFPWLIANVLDPALGDDVPIGGAAKTHMMTASNGVKIGIIGLGEREWLETINSLPPNLIYKSATETAKKLVPELRAQGADIIVCLSHMREPNDVKLATQTDGILDIILGGHDHYYSHQLVAGTHVLRSGSDFKQLSYIEARRRPSEEGKWDFDVLRRDVVAAVKPDEDMQALAASLTSKLQAKLAKSVGWTACPLDARFTTVRTRESNIANLVCDVMRSYHAADCAIMAAGTVRGDQIYPPGAIRVRDITNCFPFEDPVVFLRATGKAIWGALENSVSLYPALEGRFPQVSNIVMEFDPNQPRGKRLLSVGIGGAPLDHEKKYTLATRGYMGRGKDGYDDLLVESEGGTVEEIVCEENGILISAMLRQYFMSLRTVGQWKKLARCWSDVAEQCTSPVAVPQSFSFTPSRPETTPFEEHDRPVPGTPRTWDEFLHRRKGAALDPLDNESEDDDDMVAAADKKEQQDGGAAAAAKEEEDLERMDWELLLIRKFFGRWADRAGVRREVCDAEQAEAERIDWTRVVAPVVEGRIKMVPVRG